MGGLPTSTNTHRLLAAQMPTASEQKDIKKFLKSNAKGLGKLLDRELSKGSSDPATAAAVASFVAAHRKPWYWPF